MKKYYIKKNIIGFIIGVILCTGTFVYAAVNFPSNEVTYDNSTSGLSSTNVKGAIDELYTECTKEPTAGETIIDSAGLEKDPYECRYFFTGANPNNYITFNDEDAGWRILSVECDGRIKIVKTASIGLEYWGGTNDWATSDLSSVLINTYLNNQLNATAKSQIVASNFSIGAVEFEETSMSKQVSDENSNKWYGQIALPTVSEYIRTNSDKSNCGTFSLINDNYRSCVSTGWMVGNRDSWWTLTPTDLSDSEFIVVHYGDVRRQNVYLYMSYIRPVLYLSSEVKLSGSGTQSDPYVVS